MLENRSFDNLLGWIYGPDNPPKQVIGNNPELPFIGLTKKSYWNPSNPSYFQDPPGPPEQVFVKNHTRGDSPFTVPDPDPEEDFDDMIFQMFGTATPTEGQLASMLGFVVNYQKANASDPRHANTIMQTYSPEQVSMLSGLATNYAVSDLWFASAPCQTWPNRAFVHTGTSNGRVNNWPYDPFDFDVPTIFNILETCKFSWGVYTDTILTPSLTRLQLPQLWDPLLDFHFHGIGDFISHAKHGTLPRYSFLEPSFLFDANDEHPPHDVCMGERLLETIWNAVVNGKSWDKTLLIITFDEHGGCADHWPTPWGAATPDQNSNPGEEGFCFNRFGVRVPAVLVSPWIQAGTLFRSTTSVPFDHTSILATLRDWLPIPSGQMLGSSRIAAAPSLGDVLNAPSVRTDKPEISPQCTPSVATPPLTTPLNDLQRSMIVATLRKRLGRGLAQAEVDTLLATVTTLKDAATFFTKS
jgi:phospholipase C